MPRILAVVIALLAVLSVGAVAEAQKIRTPSKFWVRDANNKKVGVVLQLECKECDDGLDAAVVAFTIDKYVVTLGVATDYFTCQFVGRDWCGTDAVFFESPDCTGQPLLESVGPLPEGQGPLGTRQTISSPGGRTTLYYALEVNSPEVRTLQSSYSSSTEVLPDLRGCSNMAPRQESVFPAGSLDLDAAFTPPFRVTAQ
jgi:hypothetical protein